MADKYEYPKILTDADWQKNKGLVAKAGGETGIGAQLKKVKTAYDQVDWEKFNTFVIGGDFRVKTPDDVDSKKQEAIEEYKKTVVKLRQELATVKSLASKVEVEHAKKIEKAAEKMHLDLKDSSVYFTTVLKEFEQLKEKMQEGEVKKTETARKLAKEYISSLRKKAMLVVDEATPQKWNEFWSGPIRGLGLCLAKYPDEAVRNWYEKNFIKLTNNDFGTAEAGQITGRLKVVLFAAEQVEKMLK